MPDRELTPAEVAAFDAVFVTGLREALKRKKGLLLMETRIADHAAWTCLYPPAWLQGPDAAEWARDHGVKLSPGDRYLTLGEVARAIADLSLG
jgi:hypothetical protein